MTSTYEIIKALPGKGTNWKRLVDALVNHYSAEYIRVNGCAERWTVNTLDMWNKAKGVREMRTAAMEAANFAVGLVDRRAVHIPASEETLSCGGFLGGETVIVREHEAEAEAIARIKEIIYNNK